jgi:uroporphyrinogen-III synthase
MRLLLTRAAEDAGRTRATLEAAGHVVSVSPVLDIVATGAPWPSAMIDGAVATSGQAFRHLDHGPSLEAQRLMPLFLVGARTGEEAVKRGFTGPQVVAPNATALAVTLAERSTRPRRLAYLAGRDRKPDLEMALKVTGQDLEVVEVYAANALVALDPHVAQAIGSGSIDGILHFSRRSAALFVAAAGERTADVARLAQFCLSEDVAGPLREAGCTDVRIAEAPNEAALLALLGKGPI